MVLVLRQNDYGFNARWKLGLCGHEEDSRSELDWRDLELMDRAEDALVHMDCLNQSKLPSLGLLTSSTSS
jgi:hypothetical protein